jgi:hypothetical protein
MRFLAMIKADKNFEAGLPPDPRLMEAIGRHTEEMVKAGVVVSTAGLYPSARGAKVHARGGKVSVTDGPFTEAKELIGGFAILEAKSKEEAIARATQFMQLHVDVLGPAYEGECEVRELAGFSETDPVAGCAHPEQLARA